MISSQRMFSRIALKPISSRDEVVVKQTCQIIAAGMMAGLLFLTTSFAFDRSISFSLFLAIPFIPMYMSVGIVLCGIDALIVNGPIGIAGFELRAWLRIPLAVFFASLAALFIYFNFEDSGSAVFLQIGWIVGLPTGVLVGSRFHPGRLFGLN